MASATQHADVAQGHLLVFSPEAQPISEPGVGEACLDVGLTVLSRGEGGSLLAPGLPSQPFPVSCFKQCHVPCSTTSLLSMALTHHLQRTLACRHRCLSPLCGLGLRQGSGGGDDRHQQDWKRGVRVKFLFCCHSQNKKASCQSRPPDGTLVCGLPGFQK